MGKHNFDGNSSDSLDAAIAKQFASDNVSTFLNLSEGPGYRAISYFLVFASQQDTGWKLYVKITAKLLGMACMFYFFVISLDLMGMGFQLATGKVASSLFSESKLFNNPFFGLMVGVLVRRLNHVYPEHCQ